MSSMKASSENLSKSTCKQEAEKNSYIQVFLRVRPFNQQELNKHALQVVDTPGSTSVVVRDPKVGLPKTFTFDRVFGANSKQIDVYKTVVAPLIAEVLLGYNCTVFAYGQTGTGKTFTMEGERTIKDSVDSDPLAGILPRALSQLFDEVRMMNCEFTMRVSFLELYNEELFDLLAPIEDNKPKTLRLFEDSNRKGSVIIQGLEEVIVQNKHEVYAVLDRGSQQRKTAATLMNATSSRSHTVFTITVHMKESSVEGEEMLKVGKLNLVDLAGSENIGKSGAVDKRAREAGSINQSLLTLGRVITALTEKTPHVPYRESKLTRLLQDSLGGKTKTSIIATVGPASSNLEETLSTLDYACRAKSIQNKPEVNQRLTKKEALNIYTEEIERLRRDLNATREKNGIYIDMENYNRTISQIESLNRELNEKSNKIRELEEAIVNKDEEIRESGVMIQDMREELQTKQAVIRETLAQKEAVERKLARAGQRVDELSHLVKYHEDTEEKMGDEAQILLSTTTDTVSIVENLHMKLDRIRTVEERNWKNSRRFRDDYHEGMEEVLSTLKRLKNDHAIHTSSLQSKLRTHCRNREREAEKFTSTFPIHCANLQKIGETILDMASKFEKSASEILAAAGDVSEAQRKKHEELGVEFANIAAEKTDELKKAIADMQNEAKNLQNLVNASFAEMNECVMHALNDTSDRYEAIDEIVKALSGYFNSFMDQAQSKLNAFESNHTTFEQNHCKQLKLIEQTIQSMRTAMEGMNKQSNQVCAELGQELMSMNTKLDAAVNASSDKLRNGKTVVGNAEKTFTEMRGELNESTVSTLGSMMAKLSVCSKNAQDSVDTMNKYKSGTEANYKTMMDNYKDCNKKIVEDLSNTKTNMKADLDSHVRDITYAQEKTLETVKTLGEIEDELVDEVIEDLNTGCDQVNAQSSKVISGCCQLAGSVEEFWDQTYLTDSPTGATPCRKRFDYPLSLSKPSPQASVLERYRRFKRDMQTAMGQLPDSGSDDDAASVKSSGTIIDERQEDFADMEVGNVLVEEDNTENQDPEVFYPPNARLLETINESPEVSTLSVNESKNVAPTKAEPSSSSSSKSSRSDSGSDGSEAGKSPKKMLKNVDGKPKDSSVKRIKEKVIEKNKRGGKGVLKTPNK